MLCGFRSEPPTLNRRSPVFVQKAAACLSVPLLICENLYQFFFPQNKAVLKCHTYVSKRVHSRDSVSGWC